MGWFGGKPTIFGNIHVSLLLEDVGSHPNWLLNPGLFPIQRTLPQIQPLNSKNDRGFGQYISIHNLWFLFGYGHVKFSGKVTHKGRFNETYFKWSLPCWVEWSLNKEYLKILVPKHHVKAWDSQNVNFVPEKTNPHRRCPWDLNPSAKILEVVAAHLRQGKIWDMAGRVQDCSWKLQN